MVPSSGPTNARIMIVGEAPGETEVRLGRPFCGASGDCLDKMLHEAGIMRSECFITNVCRERPPNNEMELWIPKAKSRVTPEMVPMLDKMVHIKVEEGWRLLKREIELVKPTVIVAFGNVSLWALTGRWGIKSWRGSLLTMGNESVLPSVKVIPTYHPAYILRDWSQRAITVQDLRRAKSVLAPTEAIVPSDVSPNYTFIIRPNYEQVQEYLHSLLYRVRGAPTTISCDIETGGGHIECIGLATSKEKAICIPFVEGSGHYWLEEQEATIVSTLKQVLTHSNARVIGQNFVYDSQYLYRHWGFIPNFARDTMLSHHCQFTGLPKSLEYLSSMYCKTHVAWKWAVRDHSFKKDN